MNIIGLWKRVYIDLTTFPCFTISAIDIFSEIKFVIMEIKSNINFKKMCKFNYKFSQYIR